MVDELQSMRSKSSRPPLLTIAIPSFKGPSNLAKTLEMLSSEVEGKQGDLHLVISDNNSGDDSVRIAQESTIWKVLGQEPDIRVQPNNIGFRGNLKFLDSVARGEYVWFLGIGDYPQPRVIGKVLLELKKPHTEAINLRGAVAFSELDVHEDTKEPKAVDQAALPLYSESISLNIFRTGLMSKIDDSPNNTGDYWPHIEAILGVLSRSNLAPGWPTRHISSTEVMLSNNPDGWWFESASNPMDLYLARLNLSKKISETRPDSRWAKDFTRNLMSIHLLEFTIMIRLREKPARIPVAVVVSLVRLGVRPFWVVLFLLFSLAPRGLLRGLATSSDIKGAWKWLTQIVLGRL